MPTLDQFALNAAELDPSGETRFVIVRTVKPGVTTIKLVDEYFLDGLPCPIVHNTGARIWIMASYADKLPPEALPVGDGVGSGFSRDGDRLVSIPVELCRFLTAAEADDVVACMDADDRLLSYAR